MDDLLDEQLTESTPPGILFVYWTDPEGSGETLVTAGVLGRDDGEFIAVIGTLCGSGKERQVTYIPRASILHIAAIYPRLNA